MEPFGYVSKSIVILTHPSVGDGVGIGVGALVGTGVGALVGAGVGALVVGRVLGNSLGDGLVDRTWLGTGVGVTGGLIPPPGGTQYDMNVTAPDPDIFILICDTRRRLI